MGEEKGKNHRSTLRVAELLFQVSFRQAKRKLADVDFSSEPLAWAIAAIGALLKGLDVARAKTRSAERAADKMLIDSAIAQASGASKDVIQARLEASRETTELLKQIHALEIDREKTGTLIAVLRAEQGHASTELERVRKTMVTIDILNERSDTQDTLLSRIEKRVGGSGEIPRRTVPREEPPTDPPPMRGKLPSRR